MAPLSVERCRGTSLTCKMFAVTFSPTLPSPRVAARTSVPAIVVVSAMGSVDLGSQQYERLWLTASRVRATIVELVGRSMASSSEHAMLVWLVGRTQLSRPRRRRRFASASRRSWSEGYWFPLYQRARD